MERQSLADAPPVQDYDVHEHFNEEAYARWKAFSSNKEVDDGNVSVAVDETSNERTLEVPTFFRRRSKRR